MIDSTREQLLTLAEAAGQLPRRRKGRKTHVLTLYRWATVGCRGVVLESLQCGACRTTSREALQRFFERLTAPVRCADVGLEGDRRPRSLLRRLRDSEAAAQRLEELGA